MKPWYYFAAPAATLLGSVLTWSAGAIWEENIGLGACAYRIPYSPFGPAFNIWALIYLWSDLGSLLQFLPGDAYTGKAEVNLFAALCWTLCALWVALFNPLHRAAIVASGVVIACAAAAGVTAAILDQAAWNERDWEAIAWTAAPNALLGGWLMAASALGLGSAYLAASGEDPLCEYGSIEERRAQNRPESERARSVRALSAIPPVLSVGVAVLSAVLPNPVLPLPLSWAIWWMYGNDGYPRVYWAAMLLLWASSVVAIVRIALAEQTDQ